MTLKIGPLTNFVFVLFIGVFYVCVLIKLQQNIYTVVKVYQGGVRGWTDNFENEYSTVPGKLKDICTSFKKKTGKKFQQSFCQSTEFLAHHSTHLILSTLWDWYVSANSLFFLIVCVCVCVCVSLQHVQIVAVGIIQKNQIVY